MEVKKVFEKPEIKVIKFDVKDVITTSDFASKSSYSINSIKEFFNISVA